jgi:monoamine oxidase
MSAGTNFPEMWVSANPGQFSKGKKTQQQANWRVITAFVNNRHADVLSRMGKDATLKEMLAVLDRVFKRPRKANQTQVGLATQHFVKGDMMDWSREPYIEGGCEQFPTWFLPRRSAAETRMPTLKQIP